MKTERPELEPQAVAQEKPPVELAQDRASPRRGPRGEDTVSHDHARLSKVLILGGRWAANPRAFEIGLK